MASTNIIPVTINANGSKPKISRQGITEQTLGELNILEADLEEFVRANISALFPDSDETLLVIGQQVRNTEAGRADLVAIDKDGNIVLVEIKRDQDSITSRREAFEFQAIRYAANYALIKTQQDIVQKLFAPYIERHRNEDEFKQQLKELTSSELAARRLSQFLMDNQALDTVNRAQRIVLVAASFDQQTLSACAWLANNGIDIRCITISPFEYKEQHFFRIEQIIPPPTLASYYVNVAAKSERGRPIFDSPNQPTQTLPRLRQMFEWGLLKKGDVLYNRVASDKKATAINDKQVLFDGKQVEYNAWGRGVTGWSAINIYDWTVHEPSGKTLDILRREKVDELAQQREAESD